MCLVHCSLQQCGTKLENKSVWYAVWLWTIVEELNAVKISMKKLWAIYLIFVIVLVLEFLISWCFFFSESRANSVSTITWSALQNSSGSSHSSCWRRSCYNVSCNQFIYSIFYFPMLPIAQSFFYRHDYLKYTNGVMQFENYIYLLAYIT